MSLLLRGLAYLEVRPPPSFASQLWAATEPKLQTATGPQLANIGWAALACLRLHPPRSWVSSWMNALARASSPAAATAAAAAAVGQGGAAQRRQRILPLWQPLRRRHAQRAVEALAALGVGQLEAWCARLRVPVPEVEVRLFWGRRWVAAHTGSCLRSNMALEGGPELLPAARGSQIMQSSTAWPVHQAPAAVSLSTATGPIRTRSDNCVFRWP